MAVERVVFDGTVTLPLDGMVDVLNLWVLWEGPATRGRDRIIPGAAGVRAKKRRATVTTKTLELAIYGEKDETGALHADQRVGLEANIDYLRTNLTDPTNVGTGTRNAVLYLPSGATKSGVVHVESFELGGSLGPTATRATLDLSIKGGSLT